MSASRRGRDLIFAVVRDALLDEREPYFCFECGRHIPVTDGHPDGFSAINPIHGRRGYVCRACNLREEE